MEVEGTIKGLMPQFGLTSMFGIFVWILVFILFLGIVGVVVYFVIKRFKFNKKIVIFERISGSFEPVIKDRAMVMKHGKGGDTIFYLKKLKKYQPTPSLQTGRNTYWFWMREDNELINFTPGDFDEQAREIGAKFLDKEMRYARTSLQETFKERYDKPSFWAAHGTMILNIASITILLVFLFLIVDKLIDVVGQVGKVIEHADKVLVTVNGQIDKLDNVVNGGSGLAPAG